MVLTSLTNNPILCFQTGDDDIQHHHDPQEDHEDFIEKRSGNELLVNDALGVQVSIITITLLAMGPKSKIVL
jgi:hypothetical protein